MSLLNYDHDGNLIVPFAGQKTRTWSEIQKDRKYEENKQKWNSLNEQTKPWTNDGKKYTDEEFRIVMAGDSNNEEELVKVGKQFERKATAIRELRLLRNRYLEKGYVAESLHFFNKKLGKKTLEMPLDHTGKQLKKIVDEMPDYYRRFT